MQKYTGLFILFLFVNCNDEPRPKFFVKSVKMNEKVRIDWYVHSSIGGFAPDYLQISTNAEEPFLWTHYLCDIKFENDSLHISLWKNDYELDQALLNGIKLSVDTNGKQWNQASSRIGRLQKRYVNIHEPHFSDSYCPNGGCE